MTAPCFMRRAAAALSLATAAALLTVSPASAAEPVDITVLGFNDFHGRIDANTVAFAGTIEERRAAAGEDSTLLLSNGDSIGGSLFASSVQQDQPTIDVLNALGLQASAVGNHEFDRGFADLTDRVIPASDFPILGANVRNADGSPALEAYEVVEVGDLTVGVIGAVTEETPSLVSPSGVADITFTDPVDAVNDAVAELEALPDAPDVIVAQYHEGGAGATLEAAVGASEAFRSIVEDTDPAVDAIFTGHTHQVYAFDAPVAGGGSRPVVQAGSFGENIAEVTLSIDPDSGDVAAHAAEIVPRTTTSPTDLVNAFPRVKEVEDVVDEAIALADEIGREPVGEITADITTAFANGARDDRASESTLGNLVAEATFDQVSRMPAGADLAVVNPGGLRADLLVEGDGGQGVVTLAEANAVLPFANNLSSVTLTGESLKSVFEQQWQRDAAGNVPSRPYLQLGTSDNVRYTFDPTRPEGDRIMSLRVDGEPIDPSGSYRVAVPTFLAGGGDNFRAFTEGTAVDTGVLDFEAWSTYLRENQPLSPDFARHAVRVEGLQDTYEAGDTVSFELPNLDLTSLGSPSNTDVSLTLVQGDDEVPLGSAPVAAGAASPEVTLPGDVFGDAVLRVEAAPSGTVAELPIAIEAAEPELAPSTVRADAAPANGPKVPVRVKVSGDEGRPTGTIEILADGAVVGEGAVRGGTTVVHVERRLIGPGARTLEVRYSGDDTYAPSTTTVDVAPQKGKGR